MSKPNSVVEILSSRAADQPQSLAYRFLHDGEDDEELLSYGELDRSARTIAACLLASVSPGDRALLLYPPGLEFIKAYFGCLYAGVIAVPAYPPHPARLQRTLPMIQSIVRDASPAVVLGSSSICESLQSNAEVIVGLPFMKWIATDTITGQGLLEEAKAMQISPDGIAFLQYTSGSTGNPKGVMVTHNNLVHNLEIIKKNFGLSSENHALFWLPPYHDMGLIGGILEALYSGYPLTLMPHLSFLQRPFRWLQAISNFKADTSGGPNFAYDLCVKKIRPEQRDSLDLSGWKVAFNGAEFIHRETLQRFADYFEPCGFNRKSFLPCYGLAEATLMVSGDSGAELKPKVLLSSELSQNKVKLSQSGADNTQTIIGCGQVNSDQKIVIVNPVTMQISPSDVVGEIWIQGKSVANGYWNKTAETELIFKAQLSDNQGGPFLRTGDLGFISDNELFITGRLKDLIIASGNNHYPADIERTVETSFPESGTLGCAAFSITDNQEELLVIVVEIKDKLNDRRDEIEKKIRIAVSLRHELHIHDVRFVKLGEIPKTSSGKIKRYLCKDFYLDGTYKEILYT